MKKFQFLPNFIFRSPLNSINKIMDEKIFNEALYLSTPTLYIEYQKHLAKPLTDEKELKKLNVSLYKYQTRASNRCTPFGLFAGLSIGKWGSENKIILDSDLTQTLKRKTRLDMNILCALSQEIVKLPFIQPHLKFYPNNSIYLIGSNYRYVEYYYINNRRFHKINKVDFSEYLKYVLSKSVKGLTHSEISKLLVSDEITVEEANDFINELISSQLLIHQLEPTVTGNDFFDVLLSSLTNLNEKIQNTDLNHLILLLTEVDSQIKLIDSKLFNSIDSYKNVHSILKTFLPEISETNLFQTDLYKTPILTKQNDSFFSLATNLQSQIKNTLSFLNKITPPLINNNFEEFKRRFHERYEDYEIPLLVALDTETGIGYPGKDSAGINDLVDDIYKPIENNNNDIKWSLLQSHLLKLISASLKSQNRIIEISEDDFKDIDFTSVNLPTTFSVLFKVLNLEDNKIEIKAVGGGSSAINLLGRFGGGSDDLNSIIKQIATFEKQQMPNKILAEIIHLPESRTGNILARPCFREYEIPYLAKASVDDKFIIKMDDLTLKMQGNKLILFDKRLQKEIIPRLGNAHNYSFNSLPVYHFLCDLQNQYFSKPYLGFSWGVLANQFNFLPRVEFKNTILSSAKWQLRKNELDSLQQKNISNNVKHALFLELKKSLELPDKFLIADGDNELLIDCKNPIAIDTFIDSIKNRSEITLEEYLFEEEQAIVKDTDGGSFTNECIAVILNENDSIEETTYRNLDNYNSTKQFSIGSEWLYYKIYCGAKTADYILTEKIKHITESLLSAKVIDKWFFIRYADPEVHLRVRLHILNLDQYSVVLKLIHRELKPLLDEHIISKIQTDTYKRELDRYGDSTIELVEQLFYNDSVFVTNMLSMLDPESGSEIRWKIALRSVDELLADFKYSIEERLNLIEFLSNSFFIEHGGKKELKIVLDNKFRNLRKRLEEALNSNIDIEKEYFPIIQLLSTRSFSNSSIIRNIIKINSNNNLHPNLNYLISSILHMNLDRLFMGRNRTNEFVVYDLLHRYYKSTLARAKSSSKENTTN